MTVHHFKNIKEYTSLETPIRVDDSYEVVGFFPYTAAAIKTSSPKVARALFSKLETELSKARILDNKIVVICRDLVNFGTHDFAVQFHDGGCRLGGLEEVIGYAGSTLTIKEIKNAN
jgi:hypothetical protein